MLYNKTKKLTKKCRFYAACRWFSFYSTVKLPSLKQTAIHQICKPLLLRKPAVYNHIVFSHANSPYVIVLNGNTGSRTLPVRSVSGTYHKPSRISRPCQNFGGKTFLFVRKLTSFLVFDTFKKKKALQPLKTRACSALWSVHEI